MIDSSAGAQGGAVSSAVSKDAIRFHYDFVTLFYRLLWGPHIHHGLWQVADEPANRVDEVAGRRSNGPVAGSADDGLSTRRAQLRLTETLASYASPPRGAQVLDVGCGMGGSSVFLARKYAARVTGITLSPVQRRWATVGARMRWVGQRTRFLCQDVEAATFEPGQFDLVWSIECTEHLFDKQQFFRRAATWLRPGGRMAICAWLAGEPGGCPDREQQVEQVCRGFLCPSLGSRVDYQNWMEQSGLQMEQSLDWTEQVMRTWEICQRRVARTPLARVARWIDDDTGRFVDRFGTILRAYRTGAMQYGCFVARKPTDGGR